MHLSMPSVKEEIENTLPKSAKEEIANFAKKHYRLEAHVNCLTVSLTRDNTGQRDLKDH